MPFSPAVPPCFVDEPGRLPADSIPRQEDEARPARPAARSQGRSERLPRLQAMHDPLSRALCLERFAHHELQAIELMAWALLAYPDWPPGLRRALLLTLEEEQLHYRLYRERIAELRELAGGGPASCGPLTDYLWQHHRGVQRAADPAAAFLCAIGLTFEQANLDFALLHRDLFRAVGDEPSAELMQRVHDDEIRHVRLAARWLRRLRHIAPGSPAEAQAYLDAVPFPLSPARAKGRRFDRAGRRQAGLSDALIELVRTARPYDERQAQRAAAFGERPNPEHGVEHGPAPSLDSGLDGATPPGTRQPSVSSGSSLYLLPNLGAEEDRPVPPSARGFLRGLYGAWASLFDAASGGPPVLLPPGDPVSQGRWRQALSAEQSGPAFACLQGAAGLTAWLAHPRAAAEALALEKPLAGPRPEVVRAVHDKAFAQQQAAALGLVPTCLDGLILVIEPQQLTSPELLGPLLAEHVARWPAWLGGRFVLKPRQGTSGRGRLRGTGTLPPGRQSAEALRRMADRGGAVLEPWLDRTLDLSVQLHVPPAGQGDVEILGSTRQILTTAGQILGNRGRLTPDGALTSGDPAIEAALYDAARTLGRAAQAAGFFGICGLDSFTFAGPDGVPTLRPVVELNARFTTGTVALGLVRRSVAAGLGAGVTAWALLLQPPDSPVERPGIRALQPLPAGPLLLLAPDEPALDAALADAGPRS